MLTLEDTLRIAGDVDHTPAEIDEEIRGMLPYYLWIDNHYVDEFDWMRGGPECRRVHCEACEGDFVEQKRRSMTPYPHGGKAVCPMCGRIVTARHLGRSFRGLENKLDVVYYKPGAEPGTVVAVAVRARRYFAAAPATRPWEQELTIIPNGVAAFKWGEGAGRAEARQIWEETRHGLWARVGYVWKEIKKVSHLRFGDEGSFGQPTPDRVTLTKTFERAARGTLFEKAWDDAYWRSTDYGDGVAALAFIAANPICEYLKRLNAAPLVFARVANTMPWRRVNWRATSAAQALRVSPQRWGQIKGAKAEITPGLLTVIQLADERGWRCGVDTADAAAWMIRNESRDARVRLIEALELLPEGKRGKGLKYLARAVRQNRRLTLGDVMDYWLALRDTQADLADDAVAFPANFEEAHDRQARRKIDIKNAKLDQSIKARLPELRKRFGFEFGGLILRPMESAAEMVREGNVLGHCVGGYVSRYAAGHTVICALRRAVNPDMPWRTIEINPATGKVIQDRGYKNDWGGREYGVTPIYRAMLDLFWQAWTERKTKKEVKSA